MKKLGLDAIAKFKLSHIISGFILGAISMCIIYIFFKGSIEKGKGNNCSNAKPRDDLHQLSHFLGILQELPESDEDRKIIEDGLKDDESPISLKDMIFMELDCGSKKVLIALRDSRVDYMELPESLASQNYKLNKITVLRRVNNDNQPLVEINELKF